MKLVVSSLAAVECTPIFRPYLLVVLNERPRMRIIKSGAKKTMSAELLARMSRRKFFFVKSQRAVMVDVLVVYFLLCLFFF